MLMNIISKSKKLELKYLNRDLFEAYTILVYLLYTRKIF